jgi:DNA-binding transcriptional LysR family regulator
MQIHQLRAVAAISDTESFTTAAGQLEMSQSSLSHAIAGLEKELGVRLFERGRRGAQATDAGRRVLVHARRALEALDAIYAEADDTAASVSGRIRVGSIPSAAVAFLPRVIAELSTQYPNVETVLLEEPSQGPQRLLTLLRDHTLDAAILELPLDGMPTVPLLKDELCALVPAKSSLARCKQVSLRQLAKSPFIMSRYTSEPFLRAAYSAQGLMLKVRFEVQDLATMINLVREGLGVSIVPRLALPKVPPGLARASVSPRIVRDVGCAVNSFDRISPAVRVFLRKVQELAGR